MSVVTYHTNTLVNTFRLNARALAVVEMSCPKSLPALLESAKSYPDSPLVLGYASNVILPELYSGLVILNRIMGIHVATDAKTYVDVEIGSGEVWHDFVEYALGQGWYGLENLALIPGAVGAALVQNIGAYGVELSLFVRRCEVYCRDTGAFIWLSAQECAFGYRNSIFKHGQKNRYIIVRVVLRLSKVPCLILSYPRLDDHIKKTRLGKTVTPRCVFDAVCAIRRSRLPDMSKVGTVGSFFVNPVISSEQFQLVQKRFSISMDYFLMDNGCYKLFVGNLLSKLGWRGYRLGRFVVSSINPIVLVHEGGGDYADLMCLVSTIRLSVWRVFSIRLSPEPEIISVLGLAN